jgi:hypothetical protein
MFRKIYPKIGAPFLLFEKLFKESNRPRGENSPNLVTCAKRFPTFCRLSWYSLIEMPCSVRSGAALPE